MSRSGDGVEWASSEWRESDQMPGVRFRTVRMTLGRRADLTARIRGLMEKARFHEASEDPVERLSAASLEIEADRTILDWGLLEVDGLSIDGEKASVRSLIEGGPEELCREISAQIRRDCSLTEHEAKN